MSHRVQVRAKFTVTAGRRGGALIKGDLYDQPEPDLFPGFSASGQDVWVPEAHYDEPGIVVSAVGARCGKAFKADGRWTAIANTHVLLPRSGFDRDLLWWLFNDESFWIRGGSAQPYVQFEASLEQLITLPESLSAQHVVAAFLDRETARLDALVAAKQRLLDLLAEKRKAIIATAVTRGLDPKVKLRDSGVPWLGEIPAHWAVIRLKHLLLGIEQGWSPECYAIPAGEDDWGVLRAGCCNGGRFNEIDNKQLPPDLTPRPELEVRAGDVLMSRASGSSELIGSVALVPTNVRTKLMLSDKIYRLLVKRERAEAAFVVAALNSGTARVQIESIISGASGLAKNIAQSDVGELVFGVPALDEQAAIVAHIARETAKLDAVRVATERTIALLKERRSALIAAAVTGQLNVRAAAA